MKTLFLILFLYFYHNLFSQNKYPLYSKIWRIEHSNIFSNNEILILPKKENFFKLTSNYYLDNVDTNLVKEYLLSSFNEFRKDYGLDPVKENIILTKSSTEQSIKMSNISSEKWEHSNLKTNQFFLEGYYVAEVMSGIDSKTFNNLSDSDGNLNKIVAESIFDIFIISDKHADILLKKTSNYQVGFGVTFTSWGIMIVIQLIE